MTICHLIFVAKLAVGVQIGEREEDTVKWFPFTVRTESGTLYPLKCRTDDERNIWRTKIYAAIKKSSSLRRTSSSTASISSAPSDSFSTKSSTSGLASSHSHSSFSGIIQLPPNSQCEIQPEPGNKCSEPIQHINTAPLRAESTPHTKTSVFNKASSTVSSTESIQNEESETLEVFSY